MGARAYVGHPGGNAAPIFYAYFLPAWLAGEKLSDAVDHANDSTRGHLESALGANVLEVVRLASGTRIDAQAVWNGTRAQLYGDSELAP